MKGEMKDGMLNRRSFFKKAGLYSVGTFLSKKIIEKSPGEKLWVLYGNL
jgi:hypothetical protein